METRFLSLYGTYHIAKNGVLQVTRIEALQIAKIGAVQVTNYNSSTIKTDVISLMSILKIEMWENLNNRRRP